MNNRCNLWELKNRIMDRKIYQGLTTSLVIRFRDWSCRHCIHALKDVCETFWDLWNFFIAAWHLEGCLWDLGFVRLFTYMHDLKDIIILRLFCSSTPWRTFVRLTFVKLFSYLHVLKDVCERLLTFCERDVLRLTTVRSTPEPKIHHVQSLGSTRIQAYVTVQS